MSNMDSAEPVGHVANCFHEGQLLISLNIILKTTSISTDITSDYLPLCMRGRWEHLLQPLFIFSAFATGSECLSLPLR